MSENELAHGLHIPNGMKEFDDAFEDMAAWVFLRRTIVVNESVDDQTGYYRDLYRATVAHLVTTKAGQDEATYLAETRERFAGPLAGLAQPDIFVPLDLTEFHPDTKSRLAGLAWWICQNAPVAEDESPLLPCVVGRTARDVGPIAAGTVIIRRTGRAICHYVLPDLAIDQDQRALVPVPMARYAPEACETSERETRDYGVPFDMSFMEIMKVMSDVCGILANVPKVGPIFGLLGTVADVVLYIDGFNGPSEFDRTLSALEPIIDRAFVNQTLRDQLANISAFNMKHRQNQSVLRQTADKPNFIKTTYLPNINWALENVSGSVLNSVCKIKALYDDRITDNLNDVKLIEKILAASGLAIANMLLAHRTKIFLLAELAASAHKIGNMQDFKKYRNDMMDAFHAYKYAVSPDTHTDPSAVWLYRQMNYYSTRRVYPKTGLYWDYVDSTFLTTYYVKDGPDRDRVLEQHTIAGGHSADGRDWAQRTVAHHINLTYTAAIRDVMPIQARAQDMIKALDKMKEAIDKDKVLDNPPT